MKLPSTLTPVLVSLVLPSALHAAAVFTPGDFVLGGYVTGGQFVVGTAGTDGGSFFYDDNVWPANESPDHAIDGVGQKYLNFAELNTGLMVTPSFGGGLGSVVTSLQLWTANDHEMRDPATYELYGTNSDVSGGGPYPIGSFSLISSGALALPPTRNPGGGSVLDDFNSQTLNFANTAGYTSYLLVFPTVKDEPNDNSMQIAEVQLFGNAVPEPGSAALAGLALLAFTRRRRN